MLEDTNGFPWPKRLCGRSFNNQTSVMLYVVILGVVISNYSKFVPFIALVGSFFFESYSYLTSVKLVRCKYWCFGRIRKFIYGIVLVVNWPNTDAAEAISVSLKFVEQNF